MSDVEDFRSAMLNIRPGHAALRRRQKAEAEKAAAEGKAVVAEEPMDPKVKMFIISLCVALLSWALYLPYNNSQKLMGYNRATIDDVGVEKCRKFIGPSYCDDVRVHKLSGLAFLSCDTAKAIWNPPFGVENDTLIQNLPRSGEIWVQDLKLDNAVPKQLDLDGFEGAFHPLGLSIFPYTEPDQPIRLMVVNQANASSSTVEIFEVEADKNKLLHLQTITDPLFSNLYRITADPVQWSTEEKLAIPSFWILQHHGYSLKDQPYRRLFEDKLGLSAASGIYYNTPADAAEANIWYLSTPSGIAVDTTEHSGRNVHLAHSGSGALEIHRNSLVSPENQFKVVENKRTGQSLRVYWPAMIVQESMQLDDYPTGIDIALLPNTEDKDSSSSIVTAALPRAYELLNIAAESAGLQKVPEKRTGSRVYRTVPERRWRSTHRAVLDEERGTISNFEEVTFMAPVQKLIFSNDDGSVFSGATGVGVSDMLRKMIVVGAYEQGSLVCSI